MKRSHKIGINFGITSGVITTLGLMVGLASGAQLQSVVIAGILTIAIADSLSDALGIHISQESQKNIRHKAVWEATIATFIAKFCFTLTFLIPILIRDLSVAIRINIIWGLSMLIILNYRIAKEHNESPLHKILEHVLIAIVVIIITYFVGQRISHIFN